MNTIKNKVILLVFLGVTGCRLVAGDKDTVAACAGSGAPSTAATEEGIVPTSTKLAAAAVSSLIAKEEATPATACVGRGAPGAAATEQGTVPTLTQLADALPNYSSDEDDL